MLTANETRQLLNGDLQMENDGSVHTNEKKADTPVTEVNEPSEASAEDAGNRTAESGEATPAEEKHQDDAGSSFRGKRKKDYTKEERSKHAFAKLKDKSRELKSQIAERDRRIAELEASLEKQSGNREDYKNDEDFVDARAERIADKRELDRLRIEQRNAQDQEYIERRNSWVENCFTDERERADYVRLVQRANTDYRSMHPEMGVDRFSELLEDNRDVYDYLDDSDIGPKMMRHFILKPESLEQITSKHSPVARWHALEQLEERMRRFFAKPKLSTEQKGAPSPEPKKLPSTGKLLSTTASPDSEDKWNHKWSHAELVNYMKKAGRI